MATMKITPVSSMRTPIGVKSKKRKGAGPSASNWFATTMFGTVPISVSIPPIVRLGTPTVYSVGFAVLTVMFAVSALAGAVQVLRTRPADAGRGVWWHSALVSGANLFVLLYLGVYGMIGMRFWTF
jgi:hypothetical protein